MDSPLCKLVAAFALAGCAASEPAYGDGSSVAFLCEGGRYFWVDYSNGQARVSTSSANHLLGERPSSIGRKFSSDTVSFIHDEDRASLVGVSGGPFRRCRQIGADGSGDVPPLPETVEIENIDRDHEDAVPGYEE